MCEDVKALKNSIVNVKWCLTEKHYELKLLSFFKFGKEKIIILEFSWRDLTNICLSKAVWFCAFYCSVK